MIEALLPFAIGLLAAVVLTPLTIRRPSGLNARSNPSLLSVSMLQTG